MTEPLSDSHPQRAASAGLAYGLIAYLWWGSAVPIYLHALSHGTWKTPATELLVQRVVFGIPVLLLLMLATKQLKAFREALTDRRMLLVLAGSAALLSANWFAFIWAVNNAKLLDSSLGYYINPLVSVALGVLILGERPRRVQMVAVAMCVLAVAWVTIQRGQLPLVAVTVALSFGFYGLVRKRAPVKAAPGLCVEMILLLPIMVGLYIWLGRQGEIELLEGPPIRTGLMLLGGVMTVVPLVAFAAAAHRLRLATLGMLQYLAPTGQFVLSIVYGEPLDANTLLAFAIIWVALAMYTWDAWRANRN
ncbi:MAG: EamA family transporter RarD [Phycisphaerales bacterium]